MAPVLNFSRHMKRHHGNEKDVKKILALPAGHKLRKHLLGALRKQGNFLIYKTLIKPVKTGNKYTSHLPCVNCFGFYSRRSLCRHLKKCTGNKMVNTARAQADAQNFLIGNVPVDSELKKKVFPRMRVDDISFIAKQDIIICAYAAQYLNSHQGDHCVKVASKKMREMGKLLLEVQQLEPSIKNLFMALRPQYFDILVEAMKNIGRCELENGNSFSPSIASNVGNALKQCCEEALSFRWKRETQNEIILEEEHIDQIKILIVLLETQWKQSVSNLIDKDIHEYKLKNITLILLAEDVRKMTDYLTEAANIAITALETDNEDLYAYQTSLETIFCRLVLLNRRSFEEIQALPTELYKSTFNVSKEKQEEVDRLLAKPEKILMNNFKRIFIQGKKSNVPVLFSDDMQKHIDILLKYRENIVQKSNPYLFGNPLTSQPIIGHKVFRKYVISAGIQNTTFFTYTKLKKYIATLSQLFTMNVSDIEQLASFLGLILGVDISSYKLEDKLNQITRISKLLILMEENRILGIWGKKLGDIIDLNEDLLSTEIDKSITPLRTTVDFAEFNKNNQGSSNNSQCGIKLQRENRKGKKRIIIRWSSNQKEAVETYFSQHINEKRPPRKRECIRLKSLYPELLANKDWLKIKVFVQNKYTKK
ncbi:hypothetical protein WA026_012574 [Henosepilachna vigintioctopunctata]|uniref:Uncharacterized protein n=1 Tax=Henosepilachna vigintioctopunctata TaxID=420089 RepID=A0AAW1U815_9CUCU